MSEWSRMERGLDALAHGAAFVTIGLVLVAVGQPIWTDDAWWHLALGAAYAEGGPWLVDDPLAFTTSSPPAPASWLGDWALYQLYRLTGFNGIRLGHLAAVLASIGLAWSILRKATKHAATASLLTAAFAAMATYRFVQLRPHLFSIVVMLFLFRTVLQGPCVPSWRRIGFAVALLAIWANVHPVYPIGPVMFAGSAIALFVVSLRPRDRPPSGAAGPSGDRERARRIAIAAGAGFLASGVHPMGFDGYGKAFSLGAGNESLAVVVDEWATFTPFTLPATTSPPSLLTWIGTWCLLIAVPFVAFRVLRGWWLSDRTASDWLDPSLVACALAGLFALLGASRFIWLSIFPLCLIGASSKERLAQPVARGVVALAAVALIPGFVSWGDWPSTTRGLPTSLEGFRTPYATTKYHVPAVWFLADAGLEGNLFGRYAEGGFQSFWLGPEIRTAMNGALNMSQQSLATSFALRERIGTPEFPRFEEALDGMGVDLFLGTGLPMEGRPGRPPNYSTSYLERSENWIIVFRSLDSSIYLRRNERNAANLERVVAYYEAREVPFDRVRGFDPGAAIREAPQWARRNGVEPRALIVPDGPHGEAGAAAGLASINLALGLYDEAIESNDTFLEASPNNRAGLERRLWLMLRPGRSVDRAPLAEAIRSLAAATPSTRRATDLVSTARAIYAGQPVRPGMLYRLPVFSREEGRALLGAMAAPETRWE